MKSNTKVFKLTPMSGKLTKLKNPSKGLDTVIDLRTVPNQTVSIIIGYHPDYDKLTRDPRAWEIQAKAIIHQLSQRKDASKL